MKCEKARGKYTGFYGHMHRVARKILSLLRPDLRLSPRGGFVSPAVYLCRHRNLRGPVLTLLSMPVDVHPWVFYRLTDRELCRRHLAEYTFSVRFGWPRFLAGLVARPLSRVIAGYMRSVGAIPVYRGTRMITETFRLSLEALERGESIMIYPDVDYSGRARGVAGGTRDIYHGFLDLERGYVESTGAHLSFVALRADEGEGKLIAEQTSRFPDGGDFHKEKASMTRALLGYLDGKRVSHE